MIFTRLARKNNAASTLALAVSIAAGGLVAASAFEAPAFAQKEKKSQQRSKWPTIVMKMITPQKYQLSAMTSVKSEG